MSRRTPEFSLHSLLFDPPAPHSEEAEQIEIRQKIIRELQRLPSANGKLSRPGGSQWRDLSAMARRYRRCPQTVCNWADAAAAKLRPRLEGCL